MKLLFKLKRLLGLQVNMVVMCYIEDLNLWTIQQHDLTARKLSILYKTENILIVQGSPTKIDIQYF